MMFQIRNATHDDLPQLLELENVWPEDTRATEHDLNLRINAFPAGYFVAESDLGIIGSMIAHPYVYNPYDLSNFKSWEKVNQACAIQRIPFDGCNALYLLSGTNTAHGYAKALFIQALERALDLAKKIGKSYIVAGIILPGYARFISKHGLITPENYVFKQSNGRCVDPYIERFRQLGFHVPTKEHVIANYFPDKNSLNYSALVVKSL
tara:strand:+ start:120391 stop:121014 length:624 start_codon:yes stop_codon:yes gene_type:complete